MTKKIPKLIACALAFFFLWQTVQPAQAKNDAEIAGLTVHRERGSLLVSFQISNCFTQDMEEAILSGVSTTFHIRVQLDRRGFGLPPIAPIPVITPIFKPHVLDIVLNRTIKYDRLRNVFLVDLQENRELERSTADFSEAKEWMSTVRELPLMPLWRLDKGEYDLRVKAELSKIELPFFFKYIFFFVSLWDFETSWASVQFTM